MSAPRRSLLWTRIGVEDHRGFVKEVLLAAQAARYSPSAEVHVWIFHILEILLLSDVKNGRVDLVLGRAESRIVYGDSDIFNGLILAAHPKSASPRLIWIPLVFHLTQLLKEFETWPRWGFAFGIWLNLLLCLVDWLLIEIAWRPLVSKLMLWWLARTSDDLGLVKVVFSLSEVFHLKYRVSGHGFRRCCVDFSLDIAPADVEVQWTTSRVFLSVFDYGFQALVIDILFNLLHLFGMDFLVRQFANGKLRQHSVKTEPTISVINRDRDIIIVTLVISIESILLFTTESFRFVARGCEKMVLLRLLGLALLEKCE